MRSALRSAGADDVRLAVRDVTLRRLVVEDVGFRLRRVPIRAERVTMRREHWWTPTLGKVDVAGARVGIDVSTRGMNTGSPAYAVLSKIEGGILELRLDALDFKIHPPGAPEGRSAQLHLSGLPVDQSVKAPVSLDVNVNGPVERLLDLGLDSRMHIGSPAR